MFVRQNTPHPKELKAKAHKLFGSKGKWNSSDESERSQLEPVQESRTPEKSETIENKFVEAVVAPSNEQDIAVSSNTDETEEDEDEVGFCGVHF